VALTFSCRCRRGGVVKDSGTNNAGLTWTGWLRRRRGEPWRRACEAPTLGECARLLLTLGDQLGLPSRCRCLTTGAPPDLPEDRRGGRTAATLCSVVGTCKHLGIDPFAYLREALPALFALGNSPSEASVTVWLPDAWQGRAHTSALASTPPTPPEPPEVAGAITQ
jgi:hypothetical protein